MLFDELKKFCLEKITKYPEYKVRLMKELYRAKIAYEDNINLYDEILELSKTDSINDAYVIPFLLGFTKKVDLTKPLEIKQTITGGGGGLDIDTDFPTSGKPLIKEYLENKYGKEYVCSIGTYTSIGLAFAIKDILRNEGVEFKISNLFCSKLSNDLTFEENMNVYKEGEKELYKIYLRYKEALDFVPKLQNKIRSIGKHAGGILISDKPLYDRVPVVRVQDELVSSFEESGASDELDSIGLVKYDILGITVLDQISYAIDMIDEKLFKVIEDGIIKIVPESYIKMREMQNENDDK